jgi:hypothetical protein
VAKIDAFASSLLEEAKRFLEKASTEKDTTGINAYLHASLLLAFSSLEAHINAISEDFVKRPELSVLEKGLLSEREVRLEEGEFIVTNQLKISRLEDRISFLYRRFAGTSLDRQSDWWCQLSGAMDLRNKLSHPKDAHDVTLLSVTSAIRSIVATLDTLYRTIYKRALPAAKLGLRSKADF